MAGIGGGCGRTDVGGHLGVDAEGLGLDGVRRVQPAVRWEDVVQLPADADLLPTERNWSNIMPIRGQIQHNER